MMDFKTFHLAQAAIAGIETAHLICKRQLHQEGVPVYGHTIQFFACALLLHPLKCDHISGPVKVLRLLANLKPGANP